MGYGAKSVIKTIWTAIRKGDVRLLINAEKVIPQGQTMVRR